MINTSYGEYPGRASYTGSDRIRPADLSSRWIGLEPKRPEHWGNHPDRHCINATTDPDDYVEFVPDKGGDFNKPKRICQGCPVINECLQEALRDELQGIWGGTTTQDRERIKQGIESVEQARKIKQRGGSYRGDECPAGHEYAPGNVAYYGGNRRCVECLRANWRRTAARRKAARLARKEGAA